MTMDQTTPTALTLAGFDPSSGAGITADLAVFAAHRVFGTAAITALTVQSTVGVRRVELVMPELLSQTLTELWADLPPAGIKIGMLGGLQQVRCVVEFLESLPWRPLVVLDPVLRSSSGRALLEDEGIRALVEELLPLIDAMTPNTEELAVLSGLPCETEEGIHDAAESLARKHPNLVIVATGGHRPKPDDLLLAGGIWTTLPGDRIETSATHGTGCAFSSALLCGRLAGQNWPDAAAAAKAYVAQAMRTATPRGAGRGPMNLLWPILGQPNF
ncbi:bifunctional hydroxymethylpyrimidine kinase/phosphomethylpyrimidine kinase [Terriglobus roseus]|uniref:hydroxymethylpyrimidine kinase n=1 Tax=Terriglobus roseus TaxID=392734 RepID=A0A1H4IUR6_9BACT|nr:bifunctional hydroxymethylpyrimidine kinase/phosphomethylpyrimidine kinase [Terriglobus roseus]SEB37824.1 hydroxymethylpyrimidine/phosphomethylpyrimidine kinase [Terriglobus roseus]